MPMYVGICYFFVVLCNEKQIDTKHILSIIIKKDEICNMI